MVEREPKRCYEGLARRSQDTMLVRPWERDVMNGTSVVWEEAACRGTQHQVEFFTRQQAIGHLWHYSRPAPVGPGRLTWVFGEQIQGHAQVGLVVRRGLRRARGLRERSS